MIPTKGFAARSATAELGPFSFERRAVGAHDVQFEITVSQEMLDYCAEHNITSEVEVIDMAYINEAYERMLKGDVKYRFVIDMATM